MIVNNVSNRRTGEAWMHFQSHSPLVHKLKAKKFFLLSWPHTIQPLYKTVPGHLCWFGAETVWNLSKCTRHMLDTRGHFYKAWGCCYSWNQHYACGGAYLFDWSVLGWIHARTYKLWTNDFTVVLFINSGFLWIFTILWNLRFSSQGTMLYNFCPPTCFE